MTHACSWFFGFIGFLALWAGKFDPEVDPTYSTVMFSIFNNNTGVLVIIALLGTSMSTGAIDSYQNAIVDTISGVYLRNSNVLYSRALVVLLNVPCIVCSLQVRIPVHRSAGCGTLYYSMMHTGSPDSAMHGCSTLDPSCSPAAPLGRLSMVHIASPALAMQGLAVSLIHSFPC